ncbi:hypothetical protein [Pseudomonas nitroreducens]|uniref:hypothetical protein n=1 Tax=Pseudomonas nitroreducens TaxID=46680 RepID=UPI002D80F59B|nr:hypothetical protein [Pseudomonas nitroreducens]
MTFDQALKYFHTGSAIALALGVSRGRASQMRAAGGFSFAQQCVLEKASSGRLKATEADVPGRTDEDESPKAQAKEGAK